MMHNGQRLLLLIDDEPGQRRLVAALAARRGWRAVFANDAEAAIALLGTQDAIHIAAVLIAHWSADADVTALIAEIHRRRPALPLLMLIPAGALARAVTAMRAGASDFLIKPLAPERLLGAFDAAIAGSPGNELRPLSEKIPAQLAFGEMVGSTPDFRAAIAIAAKAARTRVPVLIEGESGVGKEMVAAAIHAASPRGEGRLVVVDCAAIPANLLESELFGHEKGAFTGAFDNKIGQFEKADGGTLYLDAIGAMPPEVQVSLLRLLQFGEIQPVGARHARTIDVRIIAAADESLGAAIEAGRFREDVYYRLNAVPVSIPPLRERAADLPALARHLLGRIAGQLGLGELGISDDALALLAQYAWPGNVRQLQDALFRAAILCDGDALTSTDFPGIAALGSRSHAVPGPPPTAACTGVTLFHPDGNLRALEEIEADVIRLAIGHYRGRMSEVARRLGIGRSTLYRKLGELGIDKAA